MIWKNKASMIVFQQIMLAALETVGSSGSDTQTEQSAPIEDGWESYTMPSLMPDTHQN